MRGGQSIQIAGDDRRVAIAACTCAEVRRAADRQRAAQARVEIAALAAVTSVAVRVDGSAAADVAIQRRAAAQATRTAQRRKGRAQRHLISIGVDVAAAAALTAAGVNRRVGASGDAV